MTTEPPFESSADPALRESLRWIVRLRWGAIGLEIAVLCLAVGAFHVRFLPYALVTIWAVIAVTIATNLALNRWLAREPDVGAAQIGGLLVLDVVLFTELLAFSGGPHNPFTSFYLVHVTLAAVALGAGWTWGICALSSLGFASLFLFHLPLRMPHVHGSGAVLDVHLQGMLLALAMTSAVIALFVGPLSEKLRRQRRELEAARLLAARNARFAALTTLAAGVAHEIGSPLGTIAVAAGELQHAATHEPVDLPSVAADAALIRSEVERCRAILERMHSRSGGTAGEAPQQVTPEELLGAARDSFSPDQRIRIEEVGTQMAELTSRILRVPRQPVVRALCAILKNALESGASHVWCGVGPGTGPDTVALVVEDDGSGISGEQLARIGEPFATTKPPGHGMGLGLFLVKLLADDLGGRLEVQSRPGDRTRVALELPATVEAREAVTA